MFNFFSDKIEKSEIDYIVNNLPALKNGMFSHESKILNKYQVKIDDLRDKMFTQISSNLPKNDLTSLRNIVINFNNKEEQLISKCYDEILKNRKKIIHAFYKESSNENVTSYLESLNLSKNVIVNNLILYSYLFSEIKSLNDFEAYLDAINYFKLNSKISNEIDLNEYVNSLIQSMNSEILNFYIKVIENPLQNFKDSLQIDEIISRYLKKCSVYLKTINIQDNGYLKKLEDNVKLRINSNLLPSNEKETKVFKNIIFSKGENFIFSMGAMTSYENHIRDLIQKDIDEYNLKYGMQYNYINDYEKNYNRQENEIHETNKNLLIENNGKNFEVTKYNELINLINYYRKLLSDINKDSLEILDSIRSYSSKFPLLKYNFRNKSIGSISQYSVMEAALLDSENNDLDLSKPTPYLISLKSKFYNEIIELKNTYIDEIQDYSNEDKKFLVLEYKSKEEMLISQFESVTSLYLREIQKYKNIINDDDMKLKIVSMFSAKYYLSQSLDIEENAKSDALLNIASKTNPDYTYFEKIIRNEYQNSIDKIEKVLSDFNIDKDLIVDIMSKEYEIIKDEYYKDVTNYRNIYLLNTQEDSSELFKLKIFPLYKGNYLSKFNIKNIVVNSIYNALNSIDSSFYLEKLVKKLNVFLFDNYKLYNEQRTYNIHGLIDKLYLEYALKEEEIINEYEEALSDYIDFFTKINNNPVLDEKYLSRFNITNKYFEHYTDNTINRVAIYDKYNLLDEQKNAPTVFCIKLVEYYKQKLVNYNNSVLNSQNYIDVDQFDSKSTDLLVKKQEFKKNLSSEIEKMKSDVSTMLSKYKQVSLVNFEIDTFLEENLHAK